MWKVLLPLTLVLTGCAAQVKSSGERSVVIRAVGGNASGAQELAEIECGKYGRKPRLSGMLAGGYFTYDCER